MAFFPFNALCVYCLFVFLLLLFSFIVLFSWDLLIEIIITTTICILTHTGAFQLKFEKKTNKQMILKVKSFQFKVQYVQMCYLYTSYINRENDADFFSSWIVHEMSVLLCVHAYVTLSVKLLIAHTSSWLELKHECWNFRNSFSFTLKKKLNRNSSSISNG